MQEFQTISTTPIFFSPLLYRYTLEEFWALPEPADRSYYELIEGVLYMSPPPGYEHNEIDSYLDESLNTFLTAHGRPGKVYHPRAAIYTSKTFDTYLEPDMMYVSKALHKKMGRKPTSADIVFEYLSESTAFYDRTTKADTYLALGVKELWLVDYETKTIEIRNAKKKKGQLFWEKRTYKSGEFAESSVLKGWRVSVKNLFASAQY